MTDQTLAQLLAALRDGSFVDAQKVADAIDARVNQGYAAAYERINFVGANGTVWNEKLEARIERLERIIKGEDTPEDLVDPRPPTRLGDEFPEPIAPNPPSKAVRVDSLPVGAECWVKARIQRPPGDRNFVALGFDADWHHYNVFPAETVVIPADPSAKELGLVRLCELHVDDEFELGGKVRVVTRVLNDGTVVTVLKEFTPGSARILSGQTLVRRVAKETAPAFSMWTAPKHDPSTTKPMVPIRELSKEEVAQVRIDAANQAAEQAEKYGIPKAGLSHRRW